MTKRDRRARRSVTLAPNDEALGPVMARIQANVAAFLGLVDDAETSSDRPDRATPVGTHHTDTADRNDPHRQAREFARRVSRTPEQVAQLAALYAATDWQTRPDDQT